MRHVVRWMLAVVVVATVVVPPFVLYRAEYVTSKRLREVTEGRFYRSGQMTAAGFREAIERYKIKTVINLQHENENPELCETWVGNWFGGPKTPEKEVCRQLNVRYELIKPDMLPTPNDLTKQPPAVADFLEILDDETAYPILIHCKAGLHRTGRLTAIYRMEYEGWDTGAALRELRANGYGYYMASEADDFIIQFVQNYKPRAKSRQAVKPTGASAALPLPHAAQTAGGQR